MRLQKSILNLGCLLLSLTLLAACGREEKIATVTLVTGFENNRAVNLMDSFREYGTSPITLFTLDSTRCVQSQVYAGFGIKSNSNSNNGGGGTDNISTFPVSLATQLAPGGVSDITSLTNGAVTWLQQSSFAPIKLPAPIGVPLEFGILGALYVSPSANSDGTCFDGGSSPVDSYSLIGHANATISGVTNVPIKIWLSLTQPTSNSHLPITNAASFCQTMEGDQGGGSNAQTCPNFDFNSVKIDCKSGPRCINYTTNNNRATLEYFTAVNGPQRITHAVKAGAFTSTYGIMLPAIKPVTVGLTGASGALTAQVGNNQNSNNGSNVPTQLAPAGGFDGAGPYPEVKIFEGSGVTAPGGISNVNLNGTNNGFTANWSDARGAVTYDVGVGSSSGSQSYTANSNKTSGDTITSGLTLGATNFIKVRANGPNSTNSFSGETTIIPLAPPGSPNASPGSATTKQITVSFGVPSGATEITISASTTGSGGSYTVLSSSNSSPQTFTFPSSGQTVNIKIEARNSNFGYSSWISSNVTTP